MDPTMRAARAELLWGQAEGHLRAGELEAAWQAATAAHDCVTDLPALHARAHAQLLPIDRALGRSRDVLVDRLLLALAPVGVFALLALYFRLRGLDGCAPASA